MQHSRTSGITIDACSFNVSIENTDNALAAMIFAEGTCNGLTLTANKFDGGTTGTMPVTSSLSDSTCIKSPTH